MDARAGSGERFAAASYIGSEETEDNDGHSSVHEGQMDNEQGGLGKTR